MLLVRTSSKIDEEGVAMHALWHVHAMVAQPWQMQLRNQYTAIPSVRPVAPSEHHHVIIADVEKKVARAGNKTKENIWKTQQ
mmetsp:Transcript_11165/g.21277  ORF Transcript_11165/g.21277 Transcript_11165/m.21277 type:complete len:82 (+) Transcript_11165:320-565(+)